MPGPEAPAVELDRRAGRTGELVLRRRDGHLEVIANGVFLMDTRDGRSERLLVRACLEAVAAPARVQASLDVVIAGLGVGFSLLEALAAPAVRQVVVLELEQALIDWHSGPLSEVTAGALDDPRVQLVRADVAAWLAQTTSTYDVVCLDVDNGPEWLVQAANAGVYDDEGLATLARRVRPGGAVGIWSAAESASFETRLRRHFATVSTHRVDVAHGGPDVVWVARP